MARCEEVRRGVNLTGNSIEVRRGLRNERSNCGPAGAGIRPEDEDNGPDREEWKFEAHERNRLH
jgi:hypothetical protein